RRGESKRTFALGGNRRAASRGSVRSLPMADRRNETRGADLEKAGVKSEPTFTEGNEENERLRGNGGGFETASLSLFASVQIRFLSVGLFPHAAWKPFENVIGGAIGSGVPQAVHFVGSA